MTVIKAHSLEKSVKLAVIISRFNEAVTEKLYQGAMKRLHERGVASEQVTTVWVPGAVEIPLVAKRFAMKKSVDAVICLGAVIRGETGHYDYVCEQVSQGCQRVMLDYDLPVIFGVLTTENGEQAFARAGGAHSDKGCEAVDCAFEMLSILGQI